MLARRFCSELEPELWLESACCHSQSSRLALRCTTFICLSLSQTWTRLSSDGLFCEFCHFDFHPFTMKWGDAFSNLLGKRASWLSYNYVLDVWTFTFFQPNPSLWPMQHLYYHYYPAIKGGRSCNFSCLCVLAKYLMSLWIDLTETQSDHWLNIHNLQTEVSHPRWLSKLSDLSQQKNGFNSVSFRDTEITLDVVVAGSYPQHILQALTCHSASLKFVMQGRGGEH